MNEVGAAERERFPQARGFTWLPVLLVTPTLRALDGWPFEGLTLRRLAISCPRLGWLPPGAVLDMCRELGAGLAAPPPCSTSPATAAQQLRTSELLPGSRCDLSHGSNYMNWVRASGRDPELSHHSGSCRVFLCPPSRQNAYKTGDKEGASSR